MRFAPIAFENNSGDNILFLTSSLIGYYDISSYNANNNIWYDLSGNNNNITVVGNDLSSTNKGLLFNGTNYLNLPTFSGSSALTMMVWGDVNYSFPNRDTAYLQTLFNKRVGSNNGFNSVHQFRLTATRDYIAWIGQGGTGTFNQGFTGPSTGSMNFIGFQSTETTSSLIYGAWANAVSGTFNPWQSLITSGSVLFPYTQPLLFGSSSSGLYTGTVGIIGIYDTMLSNEEMTTNYLAVSASTLY
jgi:hypothetical protein